MAAADLLARGRVALAWRWTPVIALALLAALLVHRLDAGRRAESERARLAEAAELEAKGQLVAAMSSRAELQAAARRLADENADLAAALEKAQKAAPGARPVLVIQGSTGPLPVAGAARPSPPSGGTAPAPAAPSCLLALGDKGEIRSDAVVLRTNAGNLVFVGTAAAWRVEPGPPERLFGGQILGKVTAEAPPAPLPRFALGGRAWWTATGSAPGSVEVNGGLRVVSGWWLDAAVRTDGAKAAGVRREW